MTKELAKAELNIRIIREQEHAKRALILLAKTPVSARIRRAGHGTQRATAMYWRRARRHLRNVERARNYLAVLEQS